MWISPFKYSSKNVYLTQRKPTWVFSLTRILPGSSKMGDLLFTSTMEMFTSVAAARCSDPIPPSKATTRSVYWVVFGSVRSGSKLAPCATLMMPVSASITNLSSAPCWMRYTTALLGDEPSPSHAFTCQTIAFNVKFFYRLLRSDVECRKYKKFR